MSLCAYCLEPLDENRQMDHVLPGSRGGYNAQDNLVPACRECNGSKQATTPNEWKKYIGLPFKSGVDVSVLDSWPSCSLPPYVPMNESALGRLYCARQLVAKLPLLPLIDVPVYVVMFELRDTRKSGRWKSWGRWNDTSKIATTSWDTLHEKVSCMIEEKSSPNVSAEVVRVSVETIRTINDPEVLRYYYPEGGYDEGVQIQPAFTSRSA